MGRFDSYKDYLKYADPNSQQGRNIAKYTGGNYNPYLNMAPTPGAYEFFQGQVAEPVNPLEFYESPTTLEGIAQTAQYGKMGLDVFNTKIGGKTIGSKLFKNFGKGAGSKIGNPFTTNVSAGTFDVATAGSGTSTLGAGASNYFKNISQGSVSAGLPTYLAGRLVRSAFDDDDPTTFTAGEMLGAGISGVGAGSAIAGMLGVAGPAGWLLGLGISLFGGRAKRNKYRKAQKEYEKKVEERNQEIKDLYSEALQGERAQKSKEEKEQKYNEMAAQYSNPYGNVYDEGGLTKKEKAKIAKMGRNGDTQLAHITNEEADLLKYLGGAGTINPKTGLKEYHFKNPFTRKGRKHNRKHINNALNAFTDNVLDPIGDTITAAGDAAADITETTIDTVSDVGQTALEATTDVAQTVAEPVFDTMEAVGETVIEPVVENVVQPVLDKGFDFVETGIEAGRSVAEMGANVLEDAFDFGVGMVTDVMSEIGENIVFPVMEGIASGAESIFGGGDIEVPDLPPLPNVQDLQPQAPIEGPNITTIDPYTGQPIDTRSAGVNFASGSMGFIGPDLEDDSDYSAQQSTE